MILDSLRNFLGTYAQVASLVFHRDRQSLIKIGLIYLFSFAFLAQAFVLTLALLKAMLTTQAGGLYDALSIELFSHHINISKITAVAALLGCYLIAASCLYYAEKRWFETIRRIVLDIVKAQRGVADKADSKQLRVGAISTIRVSGIMLVTSSPMLISFFSFAFLLYFNWRFAVLGVFIAVVGLVLYLGLGRATKKISLNQLDDEEMLEGEAATAPGSTEERLSFIATLLQYKAKSRYIANMLFVILIVGFGLYLLQNWHDSEQGYTLLVSSLLLYLVFNGIKIIGAKSVPLSRQYHLVKEFISAAGV